MNLICASLMFSAVLFEKEYERQAQIVGETMQKGNSTELACAPGKQAS